MKHSSHNGTPASSFREVQREATFKVMLRSEVGSFKSRTQHHSRSCVLLVVLFQVKHLFVEMQSKIQVKVTENSKMFLKAPKQHGSTHADFQSPSLGTVNTKHVSAAWSNFLDSLNLQIIRSDFLSGLLWYIYIYTYIYFFYQPHFYRFYQPEFSIFFFSNGIIGFILLLLILLTLNKAWSNWRWSSLSI